MKSCEFVRIA